jgi:hypothetical protein
VPGFTASIADIFFALNVKYQDVAVWHINGRKKRASARKRHILNGQA